MNQTTLSKCTPEYRADMQRRIDDLKATILEQLAVRPKCLHQLAAPSAVATGIVAQALTQLVSECKVKATDRADALRTFSLATEEDRVMDALNQCETDR